MTNDEKINLIGQKRMLLSTNLDKYKQELDELKFQLNVLQSEKNISIKHEPVIVPVKEETKPVVEEVVKPILETKETEQQIPIQEIQQKAEIFSPPKPKVQKQGFEFSEHIN